MTSDGVDGAASDDDAGPKSRNRLPGLLFIKRDDGRLAARYIERAYPHTPAGGAVPDLRRCERQVAAALRNQTDLLIASFDCGAGSAEWPGLAARSRPRSSWCSAQGWQ